LADIKNQLRLALSAPLHPDVLRERPPVLQVFYETAPVLPDGQRTSPGACLVLHGALDFPDSRTITWTLSDNLQPSPNEVAVRAGVLAQPGRFFLRLHCWHLLDEGGRMFSNAPDVL